MGPEQRSRSRSRSRGRHRSDNLYLRRVESLNEIRKLIGQRSELRLPKIVVVGDQSSGKSSALEHLTGIPFPVKAGICTKAAIVAECHRVESLSTDVFEVFDLETARFNRVDFKDLPHKIENMQKTLLDKSGKKVCTEEITVKVTGPQQMDIIVIDLPGIIHSGKGREETRELINRYIQQPQTLIMQVSEATRNDETMEAIELAKQADPAGERTLRVLTKFDFFDSEDSKRAAVNLVMQNRSGTGQAIDSCSLSPHALVCRPHGKDKQYTSQMEKEMLLRAGLEVDRAGVASLKERLPLIFAQLIQTNLQPMRETIEREISSAEEALARIGVESVPGPVMITECQQALLAAKKALREEITKCIQKFREDVFKMEGQLEKKWAYEKLQEDVFTCQLFQGKEALRECTQDILSWWKPLLQVYIKDVEASTLEVLEGALKDAQGVPVGLREIVYQRMQQFVREELFKTFSNRCWEAFGKETDWGTVNHYFTSKYDAERRLPDDLVDEFVNAIEEEHCCVDSQPVPAPSGLFGRSPKTPQRPGKQRSFDLAHCRTSLKALLTKHKDMLEKQFTSLSLHEQQQARLFDAVKAWYSVEKETFTDIVFKNTKADVLDGQRKWVHSRLFGDAKVQEAAVEDDRTRSERARLKDLLTRLQQCLTEVRGMS